MFHVRTKPFPASVAKLIKESDPRIVLVYSGERAERILISFSPYRPYLPEFINWFETVALELNHFQNSRYRKLMLRSMRDTRREWEDRRKRHLRRLSQNFRADFGRRDIDLSFGDEPSPGAWGADAWD